MAAKKTIWLTDYRSNRMFNKKDEEFKVTKIKNSTSYSPGTYISEREANDLIRSGWDVIIRGKN